jgi:A/G-specific adenine glycosylase
MRAAKKLWLWFEDNARNLPWRKTNTHGLRNPYHVWLAEIMLQQTQVATVIPYYQKFLRRYPSLKKLAAAPLENILSDWSGLGYYSRARNLHACARTVMHDFDGKFPSAVADLKKLPGIGDYTANAIAALAFQENTLAIDGNVARVLGRYSASHDRAEILLAGQDLLYSPARGGSTEALIELGALICTPKNPQCDQCPLQTTCRAVADNRQHEFPRKTKKSLVMTRDIQILVITNPAGEILTITRGSQGLFGGMVALPSSGLQQHEEDHAMLKKYLPRATMLKTFHHILTHIKFAVTVMTVKLSFAEAEKIQKADWLPPLLAKKQMPKLFQKAIMLL